MAIRSFGSWSLSGLPARGTDCRGPLALAMTDVIDGLRPGFDFPMSLRGGEADAAIRPLNASLRGPSGPWQSQGTNGREMSDERYFPEIATAPMGPRNDRCGRWSAPGFRFRCHCEEAAGRRGNPFFWQPVLAGTACTGYGLPRPLWGLAMTDVVDGLRPGFDSAVIARRPQADVAIRSFGSLFLRALPARGTDCHGPYGASQ